MPFSDRIYVCTGQKLNINFINKNWILINLTFMHTNVVEPIACTTGSFCVMEFVQNWRPCDLLRVRGWGDFGCSKNKGVTSMMWDT